MYNTQQDAIGISNKGKSRKKGGSTKIKNAKLKILSLDNMGKKPCRGEDSTIVENIRALPQVQIGLFLQNKANFMKKSSGYKYCNIKGLRWKIANGHLVKTNPIQTQFYSFGIKANFYKAVKVDGILAG